MTPHRSAVSSTAVAACLAAASLALAGLATSCRAAPKVPADAGRVVVAGPGVYRVRAADLAERLGWSDVAPDELRLSLHGVPQAVRIRGAGDDLELWFYGAGSSSPYTAENVYWLGRSGATPRAVDAVDDPAGGASSDTPADLSPETASDVVRKTPPSPGTPTRLSLMDESFGGDPDVVIMTLRLEEDAIYEPQRIDGDPWLWQSLPGPQTAAFTVTLPALVRGPTRIRVALWGSTEAAAAPDHRVRLSVNGQAVADATWDGRVGHVETVNFSSWYLRAGENSIGIEVPGPGDGVLDIPVLDWIEVRFPVRPVSEGDRLAFGAVGTSVRLSGFSASPAVWDVTDPERPAIVEGAAAAEAGAGVADTPAAADDSPADGTGAALAVVPGHSYAAAGPAGVLDPVAIQRVETRPELRGDGQGADWLAIGPAELLAPLAPLVDHRRAEGLAVAAIPAEAVFDQFEHGQREPRAVRAFLRHAASTWQPAPRYVLLVGDATYDPRGNVTPPDRNFLPTFLVPTIFGGQTGSDAAFADLDEDGRPDIAIGRVPARTADQVRVFVDKVLGDEASAVDAAAAAADAATDVAIAADAATAASPGAAPEWSARVLAVADGEEASFRQSAERFVARLARPFTGTVLAESTAPMDAADGPGAVTAADDGAGTAAEIQARIDAGVGIVAYFGHGSVGQWGKDRLFTTEAVAGLNNRERLPIVLHFTCLTGLFTHPTLDALAEAMLWHPGGGAVAALAPTSLTLASDQGALTDALAEGLSGGRHRRLGDAVLAAWRAVPVDSPGGRDVVQTFALLGDPGMALRPMAAGR